MERESRIVVITTGGTIVQRFDKELGGFVPKISGKELMGSLDSGIGLADLELIEFAMIDSRAVDLTFLYNLSVLVQSKVNEREVKGVVIVHGTDTIEITAYFLHRTVDSPHKSIAITGAMRVVTNSDYDGNANLTNALKQVSNVESGKRCFGVSINFAGNIHSPVNVSKEHSFAIDPFSSRAAGLTAIMHTNRIDWLNEPKKSLCIPLPKSVELLSPVAIVYAVPGATDNMLDGFINTRFKAVVVVAYGSGNVNENMYLSIKSAIQNKLTIILVTNCKYGGVYAEYGGIGGNQSLADLGVIMTDNLNPYQAMVVGSLVVENEQIEKTEIQKYFSNKFIL